MSISLKLPSTDVNHGHEKITGIPETNAAQLDAAPVNNVWRPLTVQNLKDFNAAFGSVRDNKATASLAHQALPAKYCAEVVRRFEASSLRIERLDGVPGDEIGGTQFGKTPGEYMERTDQTANEVRAILGGYWGAIPALMRGLGDELGKRGVELRPLCFKGEPAAIARLVRWRTNVKSDRWLLRPHEDRSQTQGYENWELSRISQIVAINLYLHSTPGSGQLVVTDWTPTLEDHRERGVEHSGYPYRNEDLLHRPHLVLPIGTGDIAILDGENLHAVMTGEGQIKDRLIANLFVGRIGKTAVYWA